MTTESYFESYLQLDFFLGEGQNVDMPSDCQNLGGGGAQAYPSH